MTGFRAFFVLAFVGLAPVAYGQHAPEGIRSLMVLEQPLITAIPKGVLFLNDAESAETFLARLEGRPPDWKFLFGKNVDER